MLGVAFGNAHFTRSGDDDLWVDLAYASMDAVGGTVVAGVSAISRLNLQFKVTTAGELQLQLVDSWAGAGGFAADITVIYRIVRCPTIYVGTQIEVGDMACHEHGVDTDRWGDGVWEPYVAP